MCMHAREEHLWGGFARKHVRAKVVMKYWAKGGWVVIPAHACTPSKSNQRGVVHSAVVCVTCQPAHGTSPSPARPHGFHKVDHAHKPCREEKGPERVVDRHSCASIVNWHPLPGLTEVTCP